MGRKKTFIDKKSATTYALVYRSTDGADDDAGAAALALAAEQGGRVLAADGADRVLVAQQPARPGEGPPRAAGGGPPPHDPRAVYRHFFGGGDSDEGEGLGPGGGGGGIPEAKRRELLSLGFPDDGYDYLKHMRVVGGGAGGPRRQQQQQQAADGEDEGQQRGGAGGPSSAPSPSASSSSAAAAVETVGPATFLRAPRLRAPAPDVRLVDARGVRTTVEATVAADELEAEMRALGLGGAARSELPARGALAAELAEVEAALAAEEEEDDEATLLAAEEEEEQAAAEAAAEEEQEAAAAGGGGGNSSSRRRGAKRGVAALTSATLEGRGDLEDDFLAFANAPPPGEERRALAPAAPVVVVGGFDEEDQGEGEGEGEGGVRRRSGRGARGTDARPAEAAAYADLNAQFDRLMHEEYDDEDEEEDEADEEQHDQEEEEEEEEEEQGGGRRGHRGRARTVGEELTPARLAALLSGGVGGGDEAPYDDDDDAYLDEYAHEEDDADDDERAKQRRERQRQARARALAELEGCAPVVPNAARVVSLDERDDEVLAATRARVAAAPRLRGDDEVDARGRVLGGAGDVGHGDEPLETLHVRRVRDRWDCESVLSLRTTASFQPSRIGDGSGPGGRRPRSLLLSPGGAAAGAGGGGGGGGLIRLSQRTGLPAGYGARAQLQQQQASGLVELDEEGEEEGEEAMMDEDDDEDDEDDAAPRDAGERRPRGETADERRARKAQAKAAQRAARENKRQLKAAFREEAGKQRRQRAAVGAGSGASTFVIP
jgi:protein LTV1